MKKYLLIGGPGNLSGHTVNKLLQNPENQIGLLTLPESPENGLSEKIKFFRGNRNSVNDLQQAIDDFKPEVIIDFVCFLPEQAETVAKIAQGKVKQFVFISTCDVYGYPLSSLPMSENGVWVKTNSPYAENKRICEEVFNKYFNSGVLPLTIIRPSYSFGNDFILSFFSRDEGKHMISRLKHRKPVFVPGDGTTLMHASAAYNTGRMIAAIAGTYSTIGKSYTCGHDTFITHDQYVDLFAKALDVEAIKVHIPYDQLIRLNRQEVADSILDDLTRHNVAFSMAAFKKDFPDFKWELNLEEAASNIVQYLETNKLLPPVEEEIFEDKLIAAWQKLTNEFGKLL